MSHLTQHILFVENGSGIGGATRCLQWLVQSCRSTGWTVSVAMAYPLPELEGPDAGVTVIPLYADAAYRRGQRIRRMQQVESRPAGRTGSVARFWSAAVLADWPVACRLACYVRRHGVHLIHANNDLLVNRVALLAGRLARVPVISHQRGWAQPSRINPLLQRCCARIVAVSDSMQHNLAACGVSGDKVCRIYDGVDSARFAEAKRRRQVTRAKLGFGAHHEVIGLPAVLLPWKGHRLFLDAFARIARQRPGAVALCVGASPANAVELKPELIRQTQALGLTDRVTWVGHTNDMPSMYAAMDLVVHTSIEPEPFGLVLLEAMASSRLILAADQAGPAEIVRHGLDGYLYSMGDAVSLAHGALTLLNDRLLRTRLARAGRDRAMEFNQDAAAQELRAVYDRALQAKSDKLHLQEPTVPTDSKVQPISTP